MDPQAAVRPLAVSAASLFSAQLSSPFAVAAPESFVCLSLLCVCLLIMPAAACCCSESSVVDLDQMKGGVFEKPQSLALSMGDTG